MGEQGIIAGLVGIVLFLAGIFVKDKIQKRKQVRDTVDKAEQQEKKGHTEAKEKYDERLKAAEKAVKDHIDSYPVTDDPVADLADRIRRRRERKRRQRDGE